MSETKRRSGEEKLDPEICCLLDEEDVVVMPKMCINAFIGTLQRPEGSTNEMTSRFLEWIKRHRVRTLLVAGCCTDICVSDFVTSTLSARNTGLFKFWAGQRLADHINQFQILVLEDCVETFDAPNHNRDIAHHVGLWTMASRGAAICKLDLGKEQKDG